MKQSIILFLAILVASCNTSETKTIDNEHNTINKDKLYDYNVEERVKEMGIELVTPEKSVANYVPSVRTGNLIFLSGKVPVDKDGNIIIGKLGDNMSVEEGYVAAKSCAESQLSAIKAEIGDLNKVVRIVKVNGFVNAATDFTELSEVVNGFSDLIVEVFGEERGKHARAAVGMLHYLWELRVISK